MQDIEKLKRLIDTQSVELCGALSKYEIDLVDYWDDFSKVVKKDALTMINVLKNIHNLKQDDRQYAIGGLLVCILRISLLSGTDEVQGAFDFLNSISIKNNRPDLVSTRETVTKIRKEQEDE